METRVKPNTSDHSENTIAGALSGETLAAMINLAGKRRSTSQRVVLYAVLASLKHPGALFTALETLDAFRNTHIMLIERKNGMPGVFCKELHEAYFGPSVGDARIRSFIDLAEGTLLAIGASSPDAPGLPIELIDTGTPVLEVLDQITRVYEEQAKEHAHQMKKRLQKAMADIENNADEARNAAINAQAIAAQAGDAGREFSIVADALSNITDEIDSLAKKMLEQTTT
jgi:hypothetical protein